MTKKIEIVEMDPFGREEEDYSVEKTQKTRRWNAAEEDEHDYHNRKNLKKRSHHQKKKKEKMWEDLAGSGLQQFKF